MLNTSVIDISLQRSNRIPTEPYNVPDPHAVFKVDTVDGPKAHDHSIMGVRCNIVDQSNYFGKKNPKDGRHS